MERDRERGRGFVYRIELFMVVIVLLISSRIISLMAFPTPYFQIFALMSRLGNKKTQGPVKLLSQARETCDRSSLCARSVWNNTMVVASVVSIGIVLQVVRNFCYETVRDK